MELVTVSSARARGTSAPSTRFADHAPARGHLGGPHGAGEQRGEPDMPRLRDAERGEHGDRRGTGAGQDLADQQDALAVHRLGHHAGKGAQQQHRQRARGGDHRDGQARAGRVQREQRRAQHLERAHRVDAAADRPQAKEDARGEEAAGTARCLRQSPFVTCTGGIAPNHSGRARSTCAASCSSRSSRAKLP